MLQIQTGWGANLRVPCDVVHPEAPSEVARRLDPRGTIARGLGRSYGDPALNEGGRVVEMTGLDRFLAFDEATGVLECEAGVSLGQIIAAFGPRGWFPLITPGTKHVTVGGCIANDVHGKAHHAQGSFQASVEALTVLLASGEVVRATREERPDLFWGSFGGLGLLGIILTARLRLRRVETTWFRQRSVRVNDLDELVAAFDRYDGEFPYSVAWIDPHARGRHLGRGVLTVGDHARLDELPSDLRSAPLALSGPAKVTVPFEMPELALNPLSLRVLNGVIELVQARQIPFAHYEKFFYPLDAIGAWNRGYGRRGFTQWQFVIPLEDGPRRMRAILEAIVAGGQLPFLNVLKRLGPASEGVLSFPFAGYTFAIDFPVRAGLPELLTRLDRMVLDAGGRINPSKDSFVAREMFRAMYPAVDRWLEIKRRYDPDGVFTSNMGRRLGLA